MLNNVLFLIFKSMAKTENNYKNRFCILWINSIWHVENAANLKKKKNKIKSDYFDLIFYSIYYQFIH